MVLMGTDKTAMQKMIISVVSDLESVKVLNKTSQYLASVRQLVYLARKNFNTDECIKLVCEIPEAVELIREMEKMEAEVRDEVR